jgi:hypothetical protein
MQVGMLQRFLNTFLKLIKDQIVPLQIAYIFRTTQLLVKYSPPLDNDSLKLSLFSFPARGPEKKNQAA